VLFPLVSSLAADSGSKVADGSRKKLGSFLMMCSMAGLTLSSTLWLTAMAANPVGAKMAESFGVHITFASWLFAASLPVLVLFFLIPFVIYKIYPPEIKHTPNASAKADEALKKMGAMHKNEYVMAGVFVGMVFFWVMSDRWGIDKTAVAFMGLGVLMLANIFTFEDMKQEGSALATLIWFAILFAMSLYLNKLGFMAWLGDHIAFFVSGYSWAFVYVALIVSYVLIHYFFVSQTAQMLALFGVFLEVGIASGVDASLMAFMLLFATNFNAIITPQGSSANVIYSGSGYIEAAEIYKIGGLVTLVNTSVFLSIGTVWILFLGSIWS
jgi:DASS family divalent anion:Na+ symporter